jgi:hypothetical protein
MTNGSTMTVKLSEGSNIKAEPETKSGDDILMIETMKTAYSPYKSENTITRNGLLSGKIREALFLALEWE